MIGVWAPPAPNVERDSNFPDGYALFFLNGVSRTNRRFELFEYRQVLVRMRQGDSDREIVRSGLMGRKKLTAVRRMADERGWLNPGQPLPDDTVIAGVFGRTPTCRAH